MLLLAAAVLFSTGGAAIKSSSLNAWQVASFRSGVAALAVLLMLRGARRVPDRATWAVGLVYAATLVLFVVANKLTTDADAIFLQATAPLYIVLAAPLLLREPVRQADLWFMLALAVGLSTFLFGQDVPHQTAPNPGLGKLAGVLSGASWGATIMGLRWLGRRGGGVSGTQPALVTGNLLACAIALPLALPVHAVPLRDVVLILFLGVFQIGLAYACLSTGITGVPALEASLLLLLEPVLNPIWAWLVHGEAPGHWALAGGALILVATIWRTWWDTRDGTAQRQ